MPVLLALPFLEIVAAFLIVGLIVAGRPLAEAITQWLDSVIGGVPVIGHRFARSVLSLTRWLSNTLVSNTAGTLDLGARWVAGLAQWASVVIGNALAWPYWLLRFQTWLLTRELPRLIHALPNAVTRVVHATTTRVVRIERTVVKVPQLTHALSRAAVAHLVASLIHPYFGSLRWLRAHVHALEAVIPHAIPIPHGITPTGIRRYFRSYLRRWTLTTAFAGAVAFALARLGVSWVRCNNVKRVGRNLCGMSPRAINDLLGLLTDLVLLTNVCRVFSLMQQGLSVVQPEITGFVTAVETWACYGDNEHPPRLSTPPLELPTAVGVSGLPV